MRAGRAKRGALRTFHSHGYGEYHVLFRIGFPSFTFCGVELE
jgi:hypothetical protein